LLLSLLIACAALGAVACKNDPAAQSIIDSLPPDSSPNGPFHRAGQPCLACHDNYGGATPFAVAGTVYSVDPTINKLIPAANIRIDVLDSSNSASGGMGNSLHACSNKAGNFYILASNWMDITFPLSPSAGGVSMQSLVGRDGSCASCHKLPDPGGTDPGGNPVTGADHDSAGVILVNPANTDPTCMTGG
jgi:hypothetical protein